MRWLASVTAFLLTVGSLRATDSAAVRLADGFQCPVGSDGKGYYKARGMRENGHLGEDWNGTAGGDTDLGAPVTATAHGVVLFARDFRLGWGNVIIVRHAYMEGGQIAYADSLYGHLDSILVREGEQVMRGQKIGTIGNNHGMYPAHLHFEMRKNLRIGMARSAFARDYTNYWDPSQFIAMHPRIAVENRLVSVPVNTFVAYSGPADLESAMAQANGAPGPVRSPLAPNPNAQPSATSRIKPRSVYKVDPYEDMRGSGY
jgi:murein DD-endopeptidase MepM/ murein hydrolase activator NlpD